MKIHVCTHCKAASITSRRKDFYCKDCGAVMIKMPMAFEEWWQMDLEERQEVIEQFVNEQEFEDTYSDR